MAIVNRVPVGLLAALDAKTLGQTPPDLGSTVTPTLDLMANYLADVPLETTVATAVTPALGIVAQVPVPAGELWVVYCVSSECIAVDSSNYGAAVPQFFTAASGGGLGVSLASLTQFSTASSLDTFMLSSGYMSPPLLARAGAIFASFYCRDVGGGAATARTNVMFRRLTI